MIMIRAHHPRREFDTNDVDSGFRRIALNHGARKPKRVRLLHPLHLFRCDGAQVWDPTLAQGEHVLPIPGTKRRRYLEENLAAGDLVLSPEDLADLDALPVAEGARY